MSDDDDDDDDEPSSTLSGSPSLPKSDRIWFTCGSMRSPRAESCAFASNEVDITEWYFRLVLTSTVLPLAGQSHGSFISTLRRREHMRGWRLRGLQRGRSGLFEPLRPTLTTVLNSNCGALPPRYILGTHPVRFWFPHLRAISSAKPGFTRRLFPQEGIGRYCASVAPIVSPSSALGWMPDLLLQERHLGALPVDEHHVLWLAGLYCV